LTRTSRTSRVFQRLRHALLAFALACGRPPEPRTAAHREVGALPLPSDLGAVVRVDAAALSAELGGELAQKVVRDAVGVAATSPSALLVRSLTAANVLWLGLPTLSAAEGAPGVLLLRGHFASLSEPQPDWSTLDGSVRVLELSDPLASAGYSRVYALPGDELWVWASAAELTSVEGALRGRASSAVLRPPERGAVSLAANPEDLLARSRAHYPELSERFTGLTRFEAFAEATQGIWRAEVTLEFAAAAQTASAGEVVERLKGALAERSCAVGALARGLFVSRFERSLRVQAWLEGPALEAVRGCVLGATCCA
jgi:hypothetical protein